MNDQGKLGFIISPRLDSVWTDLSASCLSTEMELQLHLEGWGLASLSARGASLSQREPRIEAGTSGALSHHLVLPGGTTANFRLGAWALTLGILLVLQQPDLTKRTEMFKIVKGKKKSLFQLNQCQEGSEAAQRNNPD